MEARLVEAFWASLRRRDEASRRMLAELVLSQPGESISVIARRVGGDTVPDTVVVRTSVEAVVAALAALRDKGERLRVVLPSEPVEGWAPLLALVEGLAEQGLAEVYRAPLVPSPRLRAQEAVRRLARLFRGAAARVVDVTDAGPLAVAAAYSGGARWLTVLVDYQHSAVFQRFWFTR